MFIASGCSSVARQGGVHRGQMGVGQQWGGGNSAGGVGAIVGGGGGLNS